MSSMELEGAASPKRQARNRLKPLISANNKQSKENIMEKTVSIARALKEKNRVAGRLAKLRSEIGNENSLEKGIPRGIDITMAYEQSKILRDRLVAIKSAIAIANKPIVSKIIELDEVKAEISYLNGLGTREGRFVSTNYGTRVESEYEAIIRRPQVIAEVAVLQERADQLQDVLDDFNAITNVRIEIE